MNDGAQDIEKEVEECHPPSLHCAHALVFMLAGV